MTTTTGRPARPLLIHGPGHRLDGTGALDVDRVSIVSLERPRPGAGAPPDSAVVLLLDDDQVRATADVAAALRAIPETVVVVTAGRQATAAALDHPGFFMAMPPAADRDVVLATLKGAFRHAAARLGARRMEAELARARAEVAGSRARLARSRSEIAELSEIGMALMTERDPDRLLEKIVERAMSLTDSDAGSLYLVEPHDGGPGRLR
ncbi:MAG: hypothetical protein ACOC3J_05250, partial [Gemmatimonadota bacterium]